MHDPMVVAFEIRRPWPTRRPEKVREGKPRWEWTIYRAHGRDHEGWNPRRWWSPRCWSPFVTAFGYRWFFPSLVTIWHVEPHGRDSGEVCKHWVDGKHRNSWRWHVWHWKIQLCPLQSLRSRLFNRCALCGRKGRPDVSHSWDGPRVGWRKWRSTPGLYHMECSSLVHLRSTMERDEATIRALWAWVCVETGKTDSELLERLRLSDWEFLQRNRLEHLLGFDRDENHELVRRV